MIGFKTNDIPITDEFVVSKPLPEELAKDVLTNLSCHVDHEGFDLNEIEQHYYKHNGVFLYHDKTWYKAVEMFYRWQVYKKEESSKQLHP